LVVNELQERVHRCVSEAIREVNQFRPSDSQLSDHPDSVLLGDGGDLDSLGVVNLAVTLEASVEREFGGPVGIVAALLETADPTPIRTVELLSNFVVDRISQST
jgi:acyl carrier protein